MPAESLSNEKLAVEDLVMGIPSNLPIECSQNGEYLGKCQNWTGCTESAFFFYIRKTQLLQFK